MNKNNPTQLTLHSALQQLQALNAMLRLTPRSIAIWSPNKAIPCLVRSTIREHKTEVRQMLLDCKIEVCCSPLWHKHEWYFPLEQWVAYTVVCGVCERLAYIGEPRPSKDNFDKIKVPARATEGIVLGKGLTS